MDPRLLALIEEIDNIYSNVRDLKIVPRTSPEEVRTHLEKRYDFETAVPLEELIRDMSHLWRKWGLVSVHPRYFGYFNPSVRKAAIAADALAAAFNPNLAVWSHGTVAHEIEKHVLRFLAEKFGYDPETSFANFTTAGAEANLTAVLAALTRAFPEYGEEGLQSISAQPVIYASNEAHDSFTKIVHMTGMGRKTLRKVKTGADLKLDLHDLKRQVKADKAAGYTPLLVAATAGTTAAGIIDPLEELARFCGDNDIWLHVDAAWGGAAVMSRKLRPSLHGIESSDSITCDAHKWLSVSMGAGMFFCRHRDVVKDAFKVSTVYMPGSTEGVEEPYVTTVQWSRRFTGLKVFMSCAELGGDGLEQMIDSMTELGDRLRLLLSERGWRIVNDTPLPVVCFTHERIENGEVSLDEILEKIYGDGRTWISKVTIGGGIKALRACITSYRTQQEDLEFLVDMLDSIIMD